MKRITFWLFAVAMVTDIVAALAQISSWSTLTITSSLDSPKQ